MIAAIRLLLPYMRPYRRSLLIGLAAMVGEIVTAVLTPVPIQLIIDHVVKPVQRGVAVSLDSGSVRVLLLLSGLAIVIAVLDSAFTYLDLRQTAIVSQRAVTDLRRSLFEHVQRLSLSFHHGRDTRAGEVQLRLSSDVQCLLDLAGTWLANMVTNGGTAVLMVALLFVVDWRPGLLVLGTSVPLFLVLRRHHRRLKHVTRLARRQEGRVISMVTEVLGSAKLSQAYGREREDARRHHRETETSLDYGLLAGEYAARSLPLVSLATSVCLAGVLLWGGVLAIQRQISVGQLTLILAYTRGVFGAIRQLAKLATQSQRASAAAERISDLFAEAPTVVDPVSPVRLPAQRSLEVSFEAVSFGYEGGRPVLTDVDLDIPGGVTMAVVGPTGAGKSSLISLVMRFYDPWHGSVRVGGIDVRNVALEELRANVSLVLQETLLHRDTVWNNIAFGRPDAADAEIRSAAEAAGVTAFVGDLDEGFDTMISERGTTLSGGQKQCVALARAMLRDAPIVIMDEPTSSLDAQMEALVIEGVRRLIAGRTAIVVAHRFSTIRHADLVAVLEGGRLVEVGTPAALASSGGLFSELANLQQPVSRS